MSGREIMTQHCRIALEALMRQLSTDFVCREQDGVAWLVTPYRLPDGNLIELTVTSDDSGSP